LRSGPARVREGEAAIVEEARGKQRKALRGCLDAAYGEDRVLLVRRIASTKQLGPSERQDGDHDGSCDSPQEFSTSRLIYECACRVVNDGSPPFILSAENVRLAREWYGFS
jgi:hypothetical protein